MNAQNVTLGILVIFPIAGTIVLAAIWSISLHIDDCISVKEIINPNVWLAIYACILIINTAHMWVWCGFRDNVVTKIIGWITVIFWIVWCILGMALVFTSLLDCVRNHDKISMLILISSGLLPFTILVLIVSQTHKVLCANSRHHYSLQL